MKLVRKPEVQRPIVILMHRQKDNIIMFMETGCEGVSLIHMAQYMVHCMLCCKCSIGLLGSIKCRKFLDNLSEYWLFEEPCSLYLVLLLLVIVDY